MIVATMKTYTILQDLTRNLTEKCSRGVQVGDEAISQRDVTSGERGEARMGIFLCSRTAALEIVSVSGALAVAGSVIFRFQKTTTQLVDYDMNGKKVRFHPAVPTLFSALYAWIFRWRGGGRH